MDDLFDARNTTITMAGYRLDWIKAGRFRFPVEVLWRVLRDLERVGLTPAAIGSSYAEFDAILEANGC